MEFNDYVRTKNGISKIVAFYSNAIFNDKYKRIENNLIIKSSPNILDILEPMDLLYIDISPDDCGGIVVPRIPETLDELKKYIKKIKLGEYILKYVVTHEQLKNNMYEVGE